MIQNFYSGKVLFSYLLESLLKHDFKPTLKIYPFYNNAFIFIYMQSII